MARNLAKPPTDHQIFATPGGESATIATHGRPGGLPWALGVQAGLKGAMKAAMLIWIPLALLCLGLAACLLWPLSGQNRAASARAADLAVYRDQLAEIERDLAAGLLAPAEAQAAKAEISRRLLAADAAPEKAAHAVGLRPLRWGTVLFIPLFAIAFYLVDGKPGLPGLPLAWRMANAERNGDFDALIAKVRAHVEANPKDVRGWQVMAKALMDHRDYAGAADAMAGLLRNSPQPTADMLADYGEMLVLADGGRTGAKSDAAFAEALKLQPGHAKAAFFVGLSLAQHGKADAAVAQWQKLLADAPADAPYRAAVEQAIAQAKAPPAAAPAMPGPDAETMAAAQNMSAEDRQAMIGAMVDRLAARLAENGNDLEGWLRLANARKVLGDRPGAIKALDDAAAQFKNDPAAQARITQARAELGATP